MYIHWMQVDYSQACITPKEVDSYVWSLLGAFYQGGQCEPDQLLIKQNKQQLTYQLRTPERSSLSEIYFNKYTQQALASLQQQQITCSFELIAKQPFTDDVCCCNDCSGFILASNDESTHIVKCIDCNKNIPLYKFSTSKDDHYYDFVMWNDNYKACYSLQLGSSILEHEALEELYSLYSDLSTAGLACCQTLAEKTSKPVYYYLYRYSGASEDMDKVRKCPSCGDDWLLDDALLDKYDFCCNNCHLLSNLAYDYDF